MSRLDGNEKIAREKMSEWGIDTSTKEGNADYIYKNNYGAVQARFKKECEKREARKRRITCDVMHKHRSIMIAF